MVDLHTHSNISDGSLNPIDLICSAAEQNIKAVALTDHDNTGGLKIAAEEAEKRGIDFVPGTELTVEWPTGEFHLLGLGLKQISNSLDEITAKLRENRTDRNKKIIQKMQDNGFDVSYEELENLVSTECIGRPHFAEYLVKKKIVKSRQEAFDKYLAKGRTFYVEKTGCNLDEAITAILESGGAPILAHPLSLYVSWGKMSGVLFELKERGIIGIEAYHPGARLADCKRLEQLGRELGLCLTAGSDYHGEKVRKDRHLGFTAGDLKIEDRFYYDELKPALEKIDYF